jgi:hypothetical protein
LEALIHSLPLPLLDQKGIPALSPRLLQVPPDVIQEEDLIGLEVEAIKN